VEITDFGDSVESNEQRRIDKNKEERREMLKRKLKTLIQNIKERAKVSYIHGCRKKNKLIEPINKIILHIGPIENKTIFNILFDFFFS